MATTTRVACGGVSRSSELRIALAAPCRAPAGGRSGRPNSEGLHLIIGNRGLDRTRPGSAWRRGGAKKKKTKREVGSSCPTGRRNCPPAPRQGLEERDASF